MCEKETAVKKCPMAAHTDEATVQALQEVIFWQRPVALVVILILIDLLIFYPIYAIHMNVLATIIYLCILHVAANIAWPVIGPFFKNVLFKPLPKSEDSPVKSYEEATAFAVNVHQKVGEVFNWIHIFIAEPTLEKTFIFLGVSLVCFIVFYSLGTFGTLFIVVHSIFIIPGLIPLAKKLISKIKSNVAKKVD